MPPILFFLLAVSTCLQAQAAGVIPSGETVTSLFTRHGLARGIYDPEFSLSPSHKALDEGEKSPTPPGGTQLPRPSTDSPSATSGSRMFLDESSGIIMDELHRPFLHLDVSKFSINDNVWTHRSSRNYTIVIVANPEASRVRRATIMIGIEIYISVDDEAYKWYTGINYDPGFNAGIDLINNSLRNARSGDYYLGSFLTWLQGEGVTVSKDLRWFWAYGYPEWERGIRALGKVEMEWICSYAQNGWKQYKWDNYVFNCNECTGRYLGDTRYFSDMWQTL